MPTLLEQARSFLYGAHQGALGSLNQGVPFVSAVNLIAANDGRVLLMVSELAEHSCNLKDNPQCSILLTAAGVADIQESPRLTLVGCVETVEGEQAARYLALFPHTASYLELDFYFLAVRVERARWIAGFGKAVWLEPSKLCATLPWDDGVEVDMVAHMNDDHRSALQSYLRLADAEAEKVSMAAIDPWGFWLLADGKPLRVAFEAPATSPDQVRNTLKELAEISRPWP